MLQTNKILSYIKYCTSMACLLRRYDKKYTQDKMLREIQPVASNCLKDNNPEKLKKLSTYLEKRIEAIEKQNPELFFEPEAQDYITAVKETRKNIRC